MGKSPYPGFPWRTCAGQGQALAGERKIWLLMAAGGCGLSWIEDLAAPSNEASLWPSAGAQAGWGLEKPLPALVADMAEGERAPSHELRGSWALVQGGRPGDPGQKFPRYRQSDVAPPAPCRQICCRGSSEGETLLSVHHPSIRQNGLAGLSSVFFPRQKAEQRCTALSGAAFTELVSGVAVDWQSGAYRAAGSAARIVEQDHKRLFRRRRRDEASRDAIKLGRAA